MHDRGAARGAAPRRDRRFRERTVEDALVFADARTAVLLEVEGFTEREVADITARGFHVVLWRSGQLAYALVSDVDRGELTRLAAPLAEETSGAR